MKLFQAQNLARALYTACFVLAALGILLEALKQDVVAKITFAVCLGVLGGYTFVTAKYLRCPNCGATIRINPLRLVKQCPQCDRRFGEDD